MRCGHCGEPIFVYERWVEADGRKIHAFDIVGGQLVCAPWTEPDVLRENVVEFQEIEKKSA